MQNLPRGAFRTRLTPRETETLESDTWSISSIVLWELAKLCQLRRIDLDLDDPQVVRTLARVHTWPLTLEVCRTIHELDFRSEPADELIAATSIVHSLPLVTRDETIRASKLVPLAL